MRGVPAVMAVPLKGYALQKLKSKSIIASILFSANEQYRTKKSKHWEISSAWLSKEA